MIIIVNLICMSILHQIKDTGELHGLDPVNLLEICGLHVLYISLIYRTIGNFIFLPVLVRPILEYAYVVWSLYILNNVQKN